MILSFTIGRFFIPFTAIAFKPFEPRTAPNPQRPAKLCESTAIHAIATFFSPAGPIEAILIFDSFKSSFIKSTVLMASLPQICVADLSSAFPFAPDTFRH